MRTQVLVSGAGFGDVEVEDCLVVEADSHEFHGAEVTSRDRRRDATFVRSGRAVLHFRYAEIVYHRREVAETILAALASHRRFRNSGDLIRRARRRLDRAQIA